MEGRTALKIVDECDDVIGQHAREVPGQAGATVVDLRSEEFKYALRRLRRRRQGEAEISYLRQIALSFGG